MITHADKARSRVKGGGEIGRGVAQEYRFGGWYSKMFAAEEEHLRGGFRRNLEGGNAEGEMTVQSEVLDKLSQRGRAVGSDGQVIMATGGGQHDIEVEEGVHGIEEELEA